MISISMAARIMLFLMVTKLMSISLEMKFLGSEAYNIENANEQYIVTTMGCTGPKSVIEVCNGLTFLD